MCFEFMPKGAGTAGVQNPIKAALRIAEESRTAMPLQRVRPMCAPLNYHSAL